jgi:hypothetical protein
MTSPQGRRLEQGDPGFRKAYERIHESFGLETSSEPKTGTLAHLIDNYRNAPEFLTLAAKTRKGTSTVCSDPSAPRDTAIQPWST